MTTEGWIFMVGLRVFDVGALIVWLIWFYRQRDDDASDDDKRDDGGGGPRRPDAPEPPRGGGGLPIPLPDAEPWPTRRREHGDRAPADRPPRRRPEPRRTPVR